MGCKAAGVIGVPPYVDALASCLTFQARMLQDRLWQQMELQLTQTNDDEARTAKRVPVSFATWLCGQWETAGVWQRRESQRDFVDQACVEGQQLACCCPRPVPEALARSAAWVGAIGYGFSKVHTRTWRAKKMSAPPAGVAAWLMRIVTGRHGCAFTQ